MIVVDEPNGFLLLARQMDHAKMSGLIARAWRRPTFVSPSAWEEFVAAVEHHDDYWAKTDEDAPVGPKGRPADFQTIDAARHVQIWRQSVEAAGTRGSYGQLVTAGYARSLYQRYTPADRGSKALVHAMMDYLDKLIAGLVRKMSTTPGLAALVSTRSLADAQRLFAFLDGVSLMMIHAIPMTPRTEPLPVATGMTPLQLDLSESALRITPWPLTGTGLALDLPVVLLPQRTFASAGGLNASIWSGIKQKRSWQVVPGAPLPQAQVHITLPAGQSRVPNS